MMMKRLIAIVVSSALPTLLWASEANQFDDGNNVSGLATRLAIIIRSGLTETTTLIMVFGLISVASGLLMIKAANKLQISPRYGMVTVITGFLLTSPKACSELGSQDILKTNSVQVVDDILNSDPTVVDTGNIIVPN